MIETDKKSELSVQEDAIEDRFGLKNGAAVIVPAGDYEKEGRLLRALESLDEVDMAMGLANGEYRLCNRHFQPLSGVEKRNDAQRCHDCHTESGVSYGSYLRYDLVLCRYLNWQADFRHRNLWSRELPGPRHDYINGAGNGRFARNPFAGRYNYRSDRL